MRYTFFYVIILALAIGFFQVIRPFLFPIFWAMVLAIIFHPMYIWINRHIRIPSISSFVSVILVFVIIFLPLTLMIILLIQQTIGLYQTLLSHDILSGASRFTLWIEDTSFAPYLEQARNEWTTYAANTAKTVSLYLIDNLKRVTQNSARFIGLTISMFYILYYLLKDGTKLLKRMMHLSPLGDAYEKMLFDRFHSTSASTLKSTFIIGGVQGGLGTILFLATGVPGSFVWGVIMVFISIIPAIGTMTIWLPISIFMFISGNTTSAIIIIIGGGIISMVDNLIRPPLIGKETELHPLVVFLSSLGGISLLGISGFVIGPIIATLFISIISIYDDYFKNELEQNN
jgi:predicted PurR-regulated permease PerM